MGVAHERMDRKMCSWQLRSWFVRPLSLPRTNQPSNQNRGSLKAMKKMDRHHSIGSSLPSPKYGVHKAQQCDLYTLPIALLIVLVGYIIAILLLYLSIL